MEALKLIDGRKAYDLTGCRFDKLFVEGIDCGRSTTRVIYWKCRCDCGKITYVTTNNLIRSHTKSCGLCYTFEDWCLDNDHKDYLDLWDYELNDKKPSEIGYASRKKYYFKCEKGIHDSCLQLICTITYYNRNIKCCKCGSIGQYLIDMYGDDAVEIYWANDNKYDPFNVSYGSDKDILINCHNHDKPIQYSIRCANFKNGKRCPVCSGRKTVKGINDVATTHPHLVKYFVNTNDAYENSYGSKKKVLFKCLDCGNTREITISIFCKYGVSCNVCSDGFSYPNKFMTNILQQIGVDFITEYSPEWIKPKRYDFYIPSKNLIIEMDGGFHYRNNGLKNAPLDDILKNDEFKSNKAIAHGLSIIRIDCKDSCFKYIKSNIEHSDICNLLDLSKVNWNSCNDNSISSKVRKAKDMYDDGYSIYEIMDKLKICKNTTVTYLKNFKTM